MKLQHYIQSKMNERQADQAKQALIIARIEQELLQISKQILTFQDQNQKKIFKSKNIEKKLNTSRISLYQSNQVKNKNNILSQYSILILSNLIKFLSIHELRVFRLVSKAANQLIYHTLDFQIREIQQRKTIILSHIEDAWEQPKMVGLREINNSLVQLNKTIWKSKDFTHIKLTHYLGVIYQIINKDKTTNKQVILTSICSAIRKNSNLLDWYSLSQRQINNLKLLVSMGFLEFDFTTLPKIKIIQKFMKNLNQFVLQKNYRLLSDVHFKEQSISKLDKYTKFFNALKLKYDSKIDKLPRIKQLDGLFFQNILTFCEYDDWKQLRQVSKYFNFQFKQNIQLLCSKTFSNYKEKILLTQTINTQFNNYKIQQIQVLQKEEIQNYKEFIEIYRINYQIDIDKQNKVQEDQLKFEIFDNPDQYLFNGDLNLNSTNNQNKKLLEIIKKSQKYLNVLTFYQNFYF